VQLARNAEIWSLVCGLFARNKPVFVRDLTAAQQSLLPELGSGILKSNTHDQRSALCPFCHQHQGEIEATGDYPVMLAVRCRDCGLVPIEPDANNRVALDPMWLARQLRLAMSIQSHDQPTAVSTDVWRIGKLKKSIVVLARKLELLTNEPERIDRLRTNASQSIAVVAPANSGSESLAKTLGIAWLRLEEQFSWYGRRICFCEPRQQEPPRPEAKTHGPFSEDYRFVQLDGRDQIVLSAAQAAVFRVLFEARRELSGE
jgi:hypothetical protein